MGCLSHLAYIEAHSKATKQSFPVTANFHKELTVDSHSLMSFSYLSAYVFQQFISAAEMVLNLVDRLNLFHGP